MHSDTKQFKHDKRKHKLTAVDKIRGAAHRNYLWVTLFWYVKSVSLHMKHCLAGMDHGLLKEH
ncbi:hypothetical protein THRCLA_23468 [Thraustotheca clavata]|uniref:Uncharacterized protein n=1 Tax=Thraustotheca clavata TaxID=74557 RepID=A0A1V9Y498_9STRA|nr:hypothetical protein THRCLA_23468 [Thraustotheca clavata]